MKVELCSIVKMKTPTWNNKSGVVGHPSWLVDKYKLGYRVYTFLTKSMHALNQVQTNQDYVPLSITWKNKKKMS